MDFNILFENIMTFLGNYGFIIVIIFGILHPIIDNPWSFFTMSLSFTLLGIPFGFILLISSNIVGILLLYIIIKKIDSKSKHYLYKKKVSGFVLKWIEETGTWKHILVIGVPLVPTFIIKIAFPFTEASFKKYFTTILGSYMFLYAIYTLMYFGLLGFLIDGIPKSLGFILILLFTLIVYFGRNIFDSVFGSELHNQK